MTNNPVIQFLRRNKPSFALAVLSGAASSICSVVLSLSLGRFYEIYFNDSGNKSRVLDLLGIAAGNSLSAFFIFYCILLLLKGITEWLFYYSSKLTAVRLSLWLQNLLFNRLILSKPAFFRQKKPGKYLLRFSGDLQAIQTFLTRGVILFIKDIAFLMLGCFFLFKTDYRLALIVLLYIPLLPLLNYLLSRNLKTIISARRDQKSSLLAFVSDRFFNIEAVKIFRKEKIESLRLKKRTRKLYAVSVQYHTRYAFIQAATALLLYALPLTVVFTVALQHIPVSKAHLMAFLLLLFMQQQALKRIGKIQTIWQSGITSLKKIAALLDYPEENANILNTATRFESLRLPPVSDQTKNALSEIKKGTITYVTYSASDLLLKKLTGLTADDNKEILLNNLPLESFSAAELRKITAISSSIVNLYGDTVYESAVRSRKKENLERFNNTLLNLGYKSVNGAETGVENINRLSFQQRQLLSHTRAILSNAPLLIFDRPFEGLDEITAQKCSTFFNKLIPERTILILKSHDDNSISLNPRLHSIKEPYDN